MFRKKWDFDDELKNNPGQIDLGQLNITRQRGYHIKRLYRDHSIMHIGTGKSRAINYLVKWLL